MGAILNIDSGALSKIENNKKEFDEEKIELLTDRFNLDFQETKENLLSEKIAKYIIKYNGWQDHTTPGKCYLETIMQYTESMP